MGVLIHSLDDVVSIYSVIYLLSSSSNKPFIDREAYYMVCMYEVFGLNRINDLIIMFPF